MTDLDLTALLAGDTPAPAPRFTGLPRYHFIGGNGDPDIVPVEALAESVAAVIRRDGRQLSAYNLGTGPQGYPPLRDFVAHKLSRHRSIPCTADDVLVTSGSGQGLELVNDLFVREGDVVLVEEYSYGAALRRLRQRGAELIGVPLDGHGMRIDALESILNSLAREGRRPKLIYTIPTIQNPTGSVLPLERRHRLVDLARRHEVVILEDECYADLIWATDAPPAIRSLAPDRVIHIGSFSKTLAPALRVGYATAPWPILSRMAAGKSDGGTGALDQMLVAEYFGSHFEAHVAALNRALARKLATMVEALDREFGTAVEITHPKGGIFVWLKLDGVDTTALAGPAAKAGVSINPGPDWACDQERSKAYMRLCFAWPSEEDIRDGVAALARVCFDEFGVPKVSANLERS